MKNNFILPVGGVHSCSGSVLRALLYPFPGLRRSSQEEFSCEMCSGSPALWTEWKGI